MISVLVDLELGKLYIWVNGKLELNTKEGHIDGSVRLALTTWNGSVFEIMDDVNTADFLQDAKASDEKKSDTEIDDDAKTLSFDSDDGMSDGDFDIDEFLPHVSYGGRG